MIDINAEAEKTLSKLFNETIHENNTIIINTNIPICASVPIGDKEYNLFDVALYYQHPDTKGKLPAVSYYNITERPKGTYDNLCFAEHGKIQIDIWVKNPSDSGLLAMAIKRVMHADGWQFELALDVPEPTEKITHRTMRFGKTFLLK